MNKKYLVFQGGTYIKYTPNGTTCVKDPFEASMFDNYKDALRVRNEYSERAVIPAHIYSIQYGLNIEKDLNNKLIELDSSIKRLNEIKLNLECECYE